MGEYISYSQLSWCPSPLTFVQQALDVREDIGEGGQLLAVLEQLGQIVGDALCALLLLLRGEVGHLGHLNLDLDGLLRLRLCLGLSLGLGLGGLDRLNLLLGGLLLLLNGGCCGNCGGGLLLQLHLLHNGFALTDTHFACVCVCVFVVLLLLLLWGGFVYSGRFLLQKRMYITYNLFRGVFATIFHYFSASFQHLTVGICKFC